MESSGIWLTLLLTCLIGLDSDRTYILRDEARRVTGHGLYSDVHIRLSSGIYA